MGFVKQFSLARKRRKGLPGETCAVVVAVVVRREKKEEKIG